MMVTWEDSDIQPGRITVNTAGEQCLIFWNERDREDISKDTRWGLMLFEIGHVAEAVASGMTKCELADLLTQSGHLPKESWGASERINRRLESDLKSRMQLENCDQFRVRAAKLPRV